MNGWIVLAVWLCPYSRSDSSAKAREEDMTDWKDFNRGYYQDQTLRAENYFLFKFLLVLTGLSSLTLYLVWRTGLWKYLFFMLTSLLAIGIVIQCLECLRFYLSRPEI